jgi:hypothetical protein
MEHRSFGFRGFCSLEHGKSEHFSIVVAETFEWFLNVEECFFLKYNAELHESEEKT